MTLIGKIRALSLQSEIQRRMEFYTQPFVREEREEIQLQKFNELWQGISRSVPWYREKTETKVLPGVFTSWEQFRGLMPVNNRQVCADNLQSMTDLRTPPDYLRATSGSTAGSMKFPAWNSENQVTRPDMWVGRAWHGIQPEDRCFYFWGQPTLFENGIKGKINTQIRLLKDRWLGYQRLIIFDLTDEDYQRAGQDMIRFKPSYLVGFSTALERLAYVIKKSASSVQDIHLKGIVATGEKFNTLDSQRMLEEVFHCPVIMEYGSNETDVMACTISNGTYAVFWENYFLELIDSPQGDQKELLVTSLYPRCFPLIRYRIGDKVELLEQDEGIPYGLSRFKNVLGRSRDFIEMPGGHHIHPSAFQIALRGFPDLITQIQLIALSEGVRIEVLSPLDVLPEQLTNEIHRRLGLVNPGLREVEIRVVKQLRQTPTGKTPIIWREK